MTSSAASAFGAGVAFLCRNDRQRELAHGGAISTQHAFSIDGCCVIARRFCETYLLWMLLISISGGCSLHSKHLVTPSAARPRDVVYTDSGRTRAEQRVDNEIEIEIAAFVRRETWLVERTFQSARSLAEHAYALAERLHVACDHRAVDYWARTIAWMEEASRLHRCSDCCVACASRHGDCHEPACRTASVSQSAMIRVLMFGQGYGRLDPSSHLLLNGLGQAYRIPVVHHGFPWNPEDFDRLLVFEPPADAPGNVRGRGVPLVVLTPGEPLDQRGATLCSSFSRREPLLEASLESGPHSFVQPATPFAATALIELPLSLFVGVERGQAEQAALGEEAAVTFVNPVTMDPADVSPPIAQSPAMPLIYFQEGSQYDPLRAFVNGDFGVDRARLRFFEPYQADKIPLVFVHGLLSDPTTFMEMAAAMRADPVLRTRYQIWAFRYPTGEAFLKSAAALRQELDAAFNCPERYDQTFERADAIDANPRAVVVGHSLGGLVAKIQIVNSGDRLWYSVANVPLERLRGPPERIAELRDSFFFEANPNIARVIYIATPHQGSPWASRFIGRVGDVLARNRSREERAFDAIISANPGAFSGEFSDSFPSSVELLRPSSDLLQALATIESSPDVIVNSIIGGHYRLLLAGRSDGVVRVDSAYRPEAATTTIVNATHTSIQRSSDAQQELVSLLKMHLMETTLSPPLSGL